MVGFAITPADKSVTKRSLLMSPNIRKFALVSHITVSVAWLGAVSVFLMLAIVGLCGEDESLIRASYLSADMITRFAIIPLCVAALLTGLIQSLGTAWGLLRNYWVIAKLVLTVFGMALLFLHARPIRYLAELAAQTDLSRGDYPRLRVQLVADAAAAVVLLAVAIGLSVYKPRGVTPYGWRRQRAEQQDRRLPVDSGAS